jgi:glyoxylase-like metal-dependent hydrolase (beta-lactamase superfamily II)
MLAERPNAGWDPRLRVFRAGDEVDTGALIAERVVVMVDTMSTPELARGIVEALRPELATRPLLVVNTHADWDHAWGNAAFDGPDAAVPAPIIAHALAAERLRGPVERAVLAEKQRQEPRFARVRLVPPTITSTGALRVEGGDLTLDLLPTPGHTPDHVAAWVPELRLLLAGDAAEHPIACVMDAASLPDLRASLERMARLEPAMVIPCHGGTTDPGLLRRNLAYFDALEARTRAALRAGRPPEDWQLREDLPDLLGMPFDAMLQLAGAGPASATQLYRTFHLAAARAMLAWVFKA